eukprot:365298-Chlamydomonas_euryale.AAC.11
MRQHATLGGGGADVAALDVSSWVATTCRRKKSGWYTRGGEPAGTSVSLPQPVRVSAVRIAMFESSGPHRCPCARGRCRHHT